MKECVFVINPGTTSTKVAIFEGHEEVWKASIQHDAQQLHAKGSVADQLDYRFELIRQEIPEGYRFNAVVGRGGLLRPCEGGTYRVDNDLLDDVKVARWGEHASNLGSMLASRFAEEHDAPAFVVDPVTTDEFEDISRISGVPGIVRKCRAHALNIKATARRAAAEMDTPYDESCFVVAHLGGGISIAAMKNGRISDVNDGLLGMGPFSPERAGALPLQGVIDLVRDKGYDQAKKIFSRESGFVGYFGTSSLLEVEQMIEDGDSTAKLVFDAMVYQIAKEIGAMNAALMGKAQAIIFTGGMIKSDLLTSELKKYVGHLGKVIEFPGEEEMLALAEGVIRVLREQETAKMYKEKT